MQILWSIGAICSIGKVLLEIIKKLKEMKDGS